MSAISLEEVRDVVVMVHKARPYDVPKCRVRLRIRVDQGGRLQRLVATGSSLKEVARVDVSSGERVAPENDVIGVMEGSSSTVPYISQTPMDEALFLVDRRDYERP